MPEDSGVPGVPFTLDGRPASARKGELLIAAAERSGTYIPRFCYHPRMQPVGMCRMCLVEVSGPRGATLQPACFVTVNEGMEVVTDSAKVKKAQDGVLEFLLVNHPLDCPVCDKGGECPLQDQTLAYGPGESRFVEEKRHFEKPIAISELVLLDRERCIQCARCTRFAEEVAGEAQIDFAGRGDRVEVATFPTEPFSSYFSGNTVQICPVGALTATPYRFTARPWDLDQVESTCTTCAFGCRVAVQASGDRLTRLLGIDADPVNQGWLCDKGRFVFEAVNGEPAEEPSPGGSGDASPGALRLTEPQVRKDGELVSVSWSEALQVAADGLRAAREAGGPGAVALVGGARCTNEAAYAWARLAKGVLGTDSVDAQLGDGLPGDLVVSLPRATVDEACAARAVLLLAGDVREELPVLFLRLRRAALDGDTRLVEVSPLPTSLSRYAEVTLAARPGDAPLLARALLGDAEAATALQAHPEGPAWSVDDLARAREVLGTDEQRSAGDGVVVVLGRASMAEHEGVVGAAARSLAQALPGARFLPALRRGNVLGALDMGLAPGLLPGRVSHGAGRDWFSAAWGSVAAETGLGTAGILSSAASEDDDRVRGLILVGTGLTDDFPDRELAREALERADFVLTVGGHRSEATDRADVVLPAAVAHERPGTTTNIEGRVSRLGQKVVAPGMAWPDWLIATELADALGTDLGFDGPAAILEEIERTAPAYRGMTTAALDLPSARDGVVAPLGGASGAAPEPLPIDPMATPGVESVERQGAPAKVGLAEPAAVAPPPDAHGSPPPLLGAESLQAAGDEEPHVPPVDRYALRLVAVRRLYDAGSALGASPSLAPLVATATAAANPHDLDRLGAVSGDPVRLRSARGSVVLPAEADPAVPRGVVVVGFNLPAPGDPATLNAASALIDASAAVTEVRLESVQ